jgi:hypothetical protein
MGARKQFFNVQSPNKHPKTCKTGHQSLKHAGIQLIIGKNGPWQCVRSVVSWSMLFCVRNIARGHFNLISAVLNNIIPALKHSLASTQ